MATNDDPRHNLRLTPALKKKLAYAAIESGRSMNAEILARLELSFAPDPASQMAEALRPVASLTDDDRAEVGKLLVDIGKLLAKGSAGK